MAQEITITHEDAFQAVAAAKAEVKRVSKDNRNADQKYQFASVDDFLAMVGPITARHGLFTVIDEDQCEFIEKPGKYGAQQWVRIIYQITTYHISKTHLPTVRRHIEVLRTGPQAYGSGQSYILKQYYRGLLDVPTGDQDDPDFGSGGRDASGVQHQVQHTTATNAMEVDPGAVENAVAYMREADTLDELKQSWANLPAAMKRHADVVKAKEDRKAVLEAEKSRPTDSADSDEIPY